jgi:hypothetical protein
MTDEVRAREGRCVIYLGGVAMGIDEAGHDDFIGIIMNTFTRDVAQGLFAWDLGEVIDTSDDAAALREEHRALCDHLDLAEGKRVND